MAQIPGRTPADASAPLDWTAVLEAEYEALYGTKPFTGSGPSDPAVRLHELHRLLHLRRPTAVCLSGGGVRSATFGLGVLQGLARCGVLGNVDYLSTVSGGGYVGGWLTAWMQREGRGRVLETLGREASHEGVRAPHSAVDRLRTTCRYLAPEGGVVSADLWTLLATMGRNLLLNWLVLLPLLAAALLIPRIYFESVKLFEQRRVSGPLPAFGRPGAVLARAGHDLDVRRGARLCRDELRWPRRGMVAAPLPVVRRRSDLHRGDHADVALVGVPLRAQ